MATLPIELLETKLLSPARSRALIPRTDLVERLRAAKGASVITILAAPGFGKTTLLTEWLASDDRSFAWISLDDRDNDPVVFLTYIAVALNKISPIDVGVFEALAAAIPSIEGRVIPRLSAAAAAMDSPIVLVLDDLHTLTEPRCLDALATLLLRLPDTVQVAIAGRGEPALPLPRMRAQGTVLDIGQDDLAFNAAEARRQLHEAGTDLSDGEVSDLLDSTEGWPAGLYFAALSMSSKSRPGSASSFGGDGPFVGDYIRTEFLNQLSPRITSFLVRTSALDEMNGAICDAILEERGSGAILESLSRQNLLVIPRDRQGEWYRYHHLLRDLLKAELERQEPGLLHELRRRAAHWHEANGSNELALDYAQSANDADHAARLFYRVALDSYRHGRLAAVSRWLEWFNERGVLKDHPVIALMGAWIHTLTGQAEMAMAFSAFAEGRLGDELLWDGITPASAWASQLAAVWCREGVDKMKRDAGRSYDLTPEASSQRAPAILFRGVADLLHGNDEAAEADFVDTIEVGLRTDSPHAVIVALAEKAILAIRRGSWDESEELSNRALSCIEEHHLGEYPTSALAYAASAHALFHQRGHDAARESLIRTQRLRPRLTYSMPWAAVQVRLELGRVYLAMADPAGARTVLREAESIFRHRSDLGVLRTQLDEFKLVAQGAPIAAPGVSTLTSAELRLLPYLSTHLTFPEVGDRLYVSRHTVKSQAISIYRKLGVSSRGEAVQQAAKLGLLEP